MLACCNISGEKSAIIDHGSRTRVLSETSHSLMMKEEYGNQSGGRTNGSEGPSPPHPPPSSFKNEKGPKTHFSLFLHQYKSLDDNSATQGSPERKQLDTEEFWRAPRFGQWGIHPLDGDISSVPIIGE